MKHTVCSAVMKEMSLKINAGKMEAINWVAYDGLLIE